jgi:hypothetical protein
MIIHPLKRFFILPLLFLALLFSLHTNGQRASSGYSYRYAGVFFGHLHTDRVGISLGKSEVSESVISTFGGLSFNFIDRQSFQIHTDIGFGTKSVKNLIDPAGESYHLSYTFYQLNPNFRFRYYKYRWIKPFLEFGPAADFVRSGVDRRMMINLNSAIGVQFIHEWLEYHLRYQYQASFREIRTVYSSNGSQVQNRLGSFSLSLGIYCRF